MVILSRRTKLSLAAIGLLAVVSAPGVARAGEGAKRLTVYPLVAPSAELGIYSRPVADALAKGLRKELGIEVSVSENTGDAPIGIDLIVDGSIHKEKRGIALEARLRDPASGRQVGAVSTRVRPLEDLEKSALELVDKLTPLASAWQRKERVREPIRLSGSTLIVPGRSAVPDPSESREPVAPRKAPPLFVIPRASGNAAGGAVRVDIDATNATYAFAERLGANYVTSTANGSDDAIALGSEAQAAGALYVLAVYLREVNFRYRGVLSARGSAVIRLIDRHGLVVVQKRVTTDTVVGSRGDRHTALIYSVAEQCLDIAMPDLKKALSK